MDGMEMLKELGFLKWMVLIYVLPLATYLIKDFVKNKKNNERYKVLSSLTELPPLIREIKNIIQHQYTEDVSLPMCEALIHPITDNSSRYLTSFCKDIVINNGIKENLDSIETNIEKTVDNVWAQNKDWLSKYKYKGIRLNDEKIINPGWKDSISCMLIGVMKNYNDNPDKIIKDLSGNIKTEFENIRFNALSILQKM